MKQGVNSLSQELEKVKSLANLDWEIIINYLEQSATCELAREILRQTEPFSTPEEALSRSYFICEAQNLLVRHSRPRMESLDFTSSWFDRLKKFAILKPLELKEVRLFLTDTQGLAECLDSFNGNWINSIKTQLMEALPPLSAIDHLMTPSGEIKTDASQKLFELNHEKNEQIKKIQNTLDQIVKKHNMETILQDRYVTTREGRWVLPIKSGMQHSFHGIIHSSSKSKETVFMEPEESITLNNRLREVDVEIEEEIEYLLKEISKYLSSMVEDFTTSKELLLQADIIFAHAQLSQQIESAPFKFSEGFIDLKNVKHPVLILSGVKVIANNVHLEEKKGVLILSGPNAGGKTVLLKSIGLAAHMARCGMPICADESSTLPFFKQIMVTIGDAQAVDAQLSTFAAHLKNLNHAVSLKGPAQLLLIDEICGSTDPEEGSALARSFIETFSNNGVFAVITSHLSPLKLGWDRKLSRVINGSLEFDSEIGKPTFHFIYGVAGRSLALQTAQRVGVSEFVLKRAMDLLNPEVKAQYQNLKEIEEMKKDLKKIQESLCLEQEEAKKQKSKYLELIHQFRKEKDHWLSKTVVRAEKRIDHFIQNEKVKEIFYRHDRMNEMKEEFPTIVRVSSKNKELPTTIDEFSKIFPPGSVAYIDSLEREGIIQGKPNAKGDVPVLSESMRIIVPWKKISLSKSSKTPPLAPKTIFSLGEGTHRTIDLRGKKVEEAIEMLEQQLDASLLHDEERVKIIHGHGTDTLKKAIRAHLSRSAYVTKWTAGGPSSGGDGITWVELK